MNCNVAQIKLFFQVFYFSKNIEEMKNQIRLHNLCRIHFINIIQICQNNVSPTIYYILQTKSYNTPKNSENYSKISIHFSTFQVHRHVVNSDTKPKPVLASSANSQLVRFSLSKSKRE